MALKYCKHGYTLFSNHDCIQKTGVVQMTLCHVG